MKGRIVFLGSCSVWLTRMAQTKNISLEQYKMKFATKHDIFSLALREQKI